MKTKVCGQLICLPFGWIHFVGSGFILAEHFGLNKNPWFRPGLVGCVVVISMMSLIATLHRKKERQKDRKTNNHPILYTCV